MALLLSYWKSLVRIWCPRFWRWNLCRWPWRYAWRVDTKEGHSSSDPRGSVSCHSAGSRWDRWCHYVSNSKWIKMIPNTWFVDLGHRGLWILLLLIINYIYYDMPCHRTANLLDRSGRCMMDVDYNKCIINICSHWFYPHWLGAVIWMNRMIHHAFMLRPAPPPTKKNNK